MYLSLIARLCATSGRCLPSVLAPNRFRLARGNIHLHYGKNGQIKVTKWSMSSRVSNLYSNWEVLDATWLPQTFSVWICLSILSKAMLFCSLTICICWTHSPPWRFLTMQSRLFFVILSLFRGRPCWNCTFKTLETEGIRRAYNLQSRCIDVKSALDVVTKLTILWGGGESIDAAACWNMPLSPPDFPCWAKKVKPENSKKIKQR